MLIDRRLSTQRRLVTVALPLEQGAALGRTYAEIERLNALIRTMESTRAWRLHQWWQRRKPG